MNTTERDSMKRLAWAMRLVLQADLATTGRMDGPVGDEMDWDEMAAIEEAAEAGVQRFADTYHDGDVDDAYDELAGLAWELDCGGRR